MNIASFIFRPDEVSSEDTITGCKVDTATYVTVDKEELENIDSRKHPHHRHRRIRSQVRH